MDQSMQSILDSLIESGYEYTPRGIGKVSFEVSFCNKPIACIAYIPNNDYILFFPYKPNFILCAPIDSKTLIDELYKLLPVTQV